VEILRRILVLTLLLILLAAISSQTMTGKETNENGADNYRALVLKGPKECIDECGKPPQGNEPEQQSEYQMCIGDCHPKIDYLHQSVDQQNDVLGEIHNTFVNVTEIFNVDSFFDVFVEIKTRLENWENYVESFFDIFVTQENHDQDIATLQTQINELKQQSPGTCGNGVCDDHEDNEICPLDCIMCTISLPLVGITDYSWIETRYPVVTDEEIASAACEKLEELLGDKLCIECYKHYTSGWNPGTGAYLVQIHAASIGHSHNTLGCDDGAEKFIFGYNNGNHRRLSHCMNPTEKGRIDMYYGGSWQGCHDTGVGHFSCGEY